MRTPAILLVSTALLLLSACSTATIATKEWFGYTKREQLVDSVQEARDQQQEAKEQFASALEEFLAVTGASVGELESRYSNLSKAYDRSVKEASRVRDRISDVETVASKLFGEWERELDEYSSASLRESSARQLEQTKRQYDRLIGAMRAAESKMDPVLAAFKDQVLFLKHNLNAQAIASLGTTTNQIESDVSRLIAEMERSIAEADAFVRQMGDPSA